MCAERFGVWEFLSLPYVFMHECVAHVHCGIPIVDGWESTQSEPFHEGWMDEVAARILRRFLQDPASQAHLPASAYEIERQTSQVRHARHNAKVNPEAAAWDAGSLGFLTLVRLWHLSNVEESASQVGWAEDQVISFSLRLNASTVSHEQRATFVTRLNRLYSFYRDDMFLKAVEAAPDILNIITRYSKTERVGDFVRSVVGLS